MNRIARLLGPLMLLAGSVAAVAGDAPPAAILVDPAPDAAHPARLVPIRYRTGGVDVPARLFVASGAGAHPAVLLLHGFPGTELNLDLARTLQRAGWTVMAIHYRGVWGAPGQFSFTHTIEDARAALAWLRTPANAAAYGIDAGRLVVLGHSMGGFDTVMLGNDATIAGFVIISGADLGGEAPKFATPAAREKARADWADDVSYTNMRYDDMADEIVANSATWNWATRAATLKGRPVLVFNSDDGLEPAGHALVAAVSAAGGPRPTEIKFATDHSYNDHRIALQSAILTWLDTHFSRR